MFPKGWSNGRSPADCAVDNNRAFSRSLRYARSRRGSQQRDGEVATAAPEAVGASLLVQYGAQPKQRRRELGDQYRGPPLAESGLRG